MNHHFDTSRPRFALLRTPSTVRIILLSLLILSFARVVWRLDANNLWWDESLSLQRAESDWGALLRGELVLFDGNTRLPTTDQHPFGFFVLLGLLIRLAGTDEFVLRLPAAMGATLLPAVLWTIGRFAVHRSVLPHGTPLIAALLAALNPFFLYYGQEARMYTLLPILGLVTIYLLLRWREAENPGERRRFLMGYGATTAFFLGTHYFAVLLLPIHAIIFFVALFQLNRRLAWGIAIALLVFGLFFGLAASWIIMSQELSGRNFQPISLRVLAPDLLNAFSLGLSVNIEQVWWLDLVFGATALIGAMWTLGRWSRIKAGGWLWVTAFFTPILLLLLINLVQPAYMNARHLALISGFYLMLVAAGVALIWRWQRVIGGALLTLLMAGVFYSTFNYYTLPEYGKDDFSALGEYLARELAPGDLVLLNPPELLRLYRYYLPIDDVEAAKNKGEQVSWLGVPLLQNQSTEEALAALLPDYRRIWVVTSGMFPFADPARKVRQWMEETTFQIRDVNYYSATSYLELDLYLPRYPQVSALPEDVIAAEANFGDQIQLLGYRIEYPLTRQATVPVVLYWRALQPLEARYKYLLYAEIEHTDGSTTRLPVTEREPYDGYLPTTNWDPATLLMEHSGVHIPLEINETRPLPVARLVLQIYDASTLTNLPIVEKTDGLVSGDGDRLLFDFQLPSLDLP